LHPRDCAKTIWSKPGQSLNHHSFWYSLVLTTPGCSALTITLWWRRSRNQSARKLANIMMQSSDILLFTQQTRVSKDEPKMNQRWTWVRVANIQVENNRTLILMIL